MSTNKVYGFTELSGGGTNAMDLVDGDLLADGDVAIVSVGGVIYHYYLNASSSESENSPFVISPDTNPGTKRWLLSKMATEFHHEVVDFAGGSADVTISGTSGLTAT